METDQRLQLIRRDEILAILSDEETAKVSTAEAALILKEGAEYVDLDQLELGIQRMNSSKQITMGHVLPRSAVSNETWTKIIGHLKGDRQG